MVQLWCVRYQDSGDDGVTCLGYGSCEVKDWRKCAACLTFSSVERWSSTHKGVLQDFTFMNLLIYLVCERDKTSDLESMQAFKSLKVQVRTAS